MSIRSFTVFMLLTLFATASVAAKKEVIDTDQAPPAIGPYSQGIKSGDLIFVSGQLPLDFISTCQDPDDRNSSACWSIPSGSDITYQTCIVMRNINEILKEADSNVCYMVKADVFLAYLTDFASFNAEYERILKTCDPNLPPARATVAVGETEIKGKKPPEPVSKEIPGIPRGAKLEIAATAITPSTETETETDELVIICGESQ